MRFMDRLKHKKELIDLCKKICNQPFRQTYKGIEIYLQVNDFVRVEEIYQAIRLFETQGNKYDMTTLKTELDDIMENKSILDAEGKKLNVVRIALTSEILNFAKVVKGMGERYKLSPSWEGKKPPLIEKQKDLENKKMEYEEKEKSLDASFNKLYKTYAKFDEKFCSFCLKFVENEK